MTDISMEQLPKFIEDLKKGIYKIDNRMMVEGSVNLNKFVAFNDIVISRKSISSMIKIRGKIDGRSFNTYYGDGVIVSTPTGSTAYSLSAGGPIMTPNLNAIAITPIAPHTLSARPIIVDGSTKLSFESIDKDRELHLILDGQVNLTMNEQDSLEIKMSEKALYLVKPEERDYYQVLREKLKWGDNLC